MSAIDDEESTITALASQPGLDDPDVDCAGAVHVLASSIEYQLEEIRLLLDELSADMDAEDDDSGVLI